MVGKRTSKQVSFIIHHIVKPDSHQWYEAWLKRIIPAAAKFHGHLGTHVMRPSAGDDQYQVSIRFASKTDAERWLQSDVRKKLIKKLMPHIKEEEKVDIRNGVDYWFTPVTQNHKPPKKWKQWVMTTSVIWMLAIVVPFLCAPLFKNFPVLETFGVRQLITSMVSVFLFLYFIITPYSKLFSKWLSR